MSVTIHYWGRLGNNIFQYIAAYLFSRKFNLKLLDGPKDFSSILKDNLETDGREFDNKVIEINDSNFIHMLSSDSVEDARYHFHGYYQLKEFVVNYENEIKSLFNLNYSQLNNDDDAFVFYRMGDIENQRQSIPLEYYIEALDMLKINGGYITSDSPNHQNIKLLMDKFNLKFYDNTPLETICFAKNFNNLILSEGTFSWWGGFFSNAKNIVYNKRERFWHGDIFVSPKWLSLSYDWDYKCRTDQNQLICNDFMRG
jgi:hypothetical protein